MKSVHQVMAPVGGRKTTSVGTHISDRPARKRTHCWHTTMFAKYFCALVLLTPIAAIAADRIHIVIRAFIPDSHDGNLGYVKRLRDGTTVIPAPPTFLVTPAVRAVTPRAVEVWAKKNSGNWKGALLSGALANHCFKTDGRTFTSNANASARLHFEATLVIDGPSVRIEKPAGRSRPFWSDASHLVDCQSVRDLVTPKAGDPYFVDAPFRPGSSIGEPRVDGNEVRLFVRGSGGNPLAPLLESVTPAVDFSGVITFDRKTKKLGFRGLAGTFPATEAYASLNGGAPRTIFQLSPNEGTTVWDLADLDTGVNSRGIDTTIDLVGDVVATEPSTRPLAPWKSIQRSQFVAGVLSMPGGAGIDTALLGAIANSGADAGMTPVALDKLVASAADVLRKQEQELDRAGYGSALDRVTLVRRKVERLRSTEAFASMAVIQTLSQEVRRIGVLPRSPGREPGYLVDTLLRSSIERVALRSQETRSGSTLLPVLQRRVFSEIGFSPLDRPENLAAMLANVVSDPTAVALAKAITEQRSDPVGVVLGEAVLQGVSGSVKDHGSRLRETVSNAVKALESEGKLPPIVEDFVLSEFSKRTGVDAYRLRESVRTLEADSMKIANAEAGLYIASTLGGLVDPKLGRDIERFGSAAINVYRAVNAFSAGASTGNAIFALGASGATGNFLGAAMTMSGILGGGGFGGVGGDQTPALRAEIAELRKLIEALAKRMDERFDRVDRSLDRIYVDMNAGFERIERRLAGLEEDARQIQLSLASLNGRLDAFEALVRRGQRELLAEMKAVEVEGCLRWRSDIVKPLADDRFYWCAIQLAGFAVRQGSSDAFAGGSAWDPSEAGLPARLLDPFNNVQLLFAAAQAHGVNLVAPNELDRLVSPRYWGVAVDDYLKLLADWPQYTVNIKPAQIERIRAAGEGINRGLAAISDPRTGRTLFVGLVRNYLESAIRLQLELERSRSSLIGRDVPSLPAQARPLCSYGNSGAWASKLEFPLETKLIPGYVRRAEAEKKAGIRICADRISVSPVGIDSRTVADGQVFDVYPDFSLHASADGLGGRAEVWSLSVRLPIKFKVTISNVQREADGNTTYAYSTPWQSELEQAVQGYWPKVIQLLRDAPYMPGSEPKARWPMSRQAKQFEQESLLARARETLGKDLGKDAIAAAQYFSNEVPLSTFTSHLGTITYYLSSPNSDSALATEMEHWAERRIYEDVVAAKLAVAAVRDLDVYARLIAGFVEVGLADSLRRNDALSALVRGTNTLPDSRWFLDAVQSRPPLHDVARTALARALALSTMLDKVLAEPRDTSDRGDQTVGALLAELSVLAQQKREECKLLPNPVECLSR